MSVNILGLAMLASIVVGAFLFFAQTDGYRAAFVEMLIILAATAYCVAAVFLTSNFLFDTFGPR